MVRSKNPSGSNESKSGSGRPELATLTGLLTTHKNLCPLFSNPRAISLNCSTVNDPRLPKQRKTTLRLGCESSQVSDSDRTFRFPSLVRINGPMQWIGGVRPSGTQEPSNMALMALGSSDSKPRMQENYHKPCHGGRAKASPCQKTAEAELHEYGGGYFGL
ncbi:hypothetical protein F8388_026416 [Cannabis sativa]|uniref:Uncharacterized protein n=1 Tax=Cannabis sativa TaxID=3483 RepID=A0A7J6ETT3_CANSA|nr:hypothetical protein F8388_026416 [Cannabis sativa]